MKKERGKKRRVVDRWKGDNEADSMAMVMQKKLCKYSSAQLADYILCKESYDGIVTAAQLHWQMPESA